MRTQARTESAASSPPASVMVLEELEQIQFLPGHASVQTTERYIGCRQNFREAVNDRFQISLANHAP